MQAWRSMYVTEVICNVSNVPL